VGNLMVDVKAGNRKPPERVIGATSAIIAAGRGEAF
jgi:hypothetical protein